MQRCPEQCQPLWTAQTGGDINSSPTVVNGVAYVGSDDGKLYVFDAKGAKHCNKSAETCTPLWTATTGGAVALVAGGCRRSALRGLR